MSALDPTAVRALLEPHHLALADEAAAFARATLLPLPSPASDDAARVQAVQILGLLRESTLLRFISPLDLRACCVVREALAWASPLADEVFALQCLSATPLAVMGSPAQRAMWEVPVTTGSRMGGFAMTEPNAGSDVSALETRAVKEGDQYRINGAKTLISNAGIADQYVVFASTDPSAGHRGLSCFLVDATNPGCRFVRPLVLSAPHPLGELAFEDCRVPETDRLGPEGAGMRIGMATLDRLRPTVAAAATGMAARALDEALAYSLKRRQFGHPIADFQLIQSKLATMAMDLAAARLMLYRAAWEFDRGAPTITLESAMAKAYATEAAQRIVDDAVQIHGGAGVLADSVVDRLYRSVRALRIYEGTTEVQHLVIAKHLLRDARQPS